MSNDTFIREVNEELRQDRVRSIWKRFGAVLIGLVALVILGTVAYVAWERYQSSLAAADGDRYVAALDLADAGDTQGALAALGELAESGVGAYPHLATLRIASLRETAGDSAGALAALDEVANNAAAPQALRDVAAVRAAYLLVDTGTVEDVRQRVERLTNEAEPLRHPAREALGLAAWKAGDTETARSFFQQLTEDLGAPQGISQRARLMQELIEADVPYGPAAAATVSEAPAAPPPAPAATPPAENPLNAPVFEALGEPGEGAPAAPATPSAPASPAPDPAPAAPVQDPAPDAGAPPPS